MALDVLRAAGRHPDATHGHAVAAWCAPPRRPSTSGRWRRRSRRRCSRRRRTPRPLRVRRPGADRRRRRPGRGGFAPSPSSTPTRGFPARPSPSSAARSRHRCRNPTDGSRARGLKSGIAPPHPRCDLRTRHGHAERRLSLVRRPDPARRYLRAGAADRRGPAARSRPPDRSTPRRAVRTRHCGLLDLLDERPACLYGLVGDPHHGAGDRQQCRVLGLRRRPVRRLLSLPPLACRHLARRRPAGAGARTGRRRRPGALRARVCGPGHRPDDLLVARRPRRGPAPAAALHRRRLRSLYRPHRALPTARRSSSPHRSW